LFMFISFCLMSLSLMNSRKSSSSTILSMRKVVESLIVSEFFFQQSFYVFLHLLLAIL
jgi:succinate dehydrogenase/fumarate reductase cytochrome b subunit